MEYSEIYSYFEDLKNYLIDKKDAIIHKNIEKLSSLDENIEILCQKIAKLDITNNNFTIEEKENLKTIAKEIKLIQENNEMLIKHSINVINNLLSGILNIRDNNSSYNFKGKIDKDEINISSITEEA